ncbi:choice-of-anchor D domain-containing protein, partial [bacterium]|nr:choice-of-anchor D domain-containing protein [bacterium]
GLTFVPPRQSGGQIAVHPSHAEFGNVLVSESSAPVAITVRNVGTASLTVTAISDPGPPFMLNNLPNLPLVLAAGEVATFEAVFTPAQAGEGAGVVTIASDDADDPEVQLSLTGY